MSSSITLRGAQLLPLWRRRIPKYPVYWKGDPQLRVFLPQFWMRIIKPEHDIPKNQVHFEVHPQMSDFDVKNYLEKIYKIPVLSVKSETFRGEDIKHATKRYLQAREPDTRMAYIVLGEGQEFTFPDLFADKLPPMEREMKEMRRMKRDAQVERRQSWEREAVPPWFR